MEYTIKITGKGTREQIAIALAEIFNSLYQPEGNGWGKKIDDIEGAVWEDPTLVTEISKI